VKTARLCGGEFHLLLHDVSGRKTMPIKYFGHEHQWRSQHNIWGIKKFFGGNRLTLGKQQYLVGDTASQSTK